MEEHRTERERKLAQHRVAAEVDKQAKEREEAWRKNEALEIRKRLREEAAAPATFKSGSDHIIAATSKPDAAPDKGARGDVDVRRRE